MAMDVGNATINPSINPRNHISKKLETKPMFIRVRIKDIAKDMINDTSTPNKISEYFLFIFIILFFREF